MSEELLKAIIQLFAIVTRERITDDERNNIREFLAQHLNRDSVKYYLELFDSYVSTRQPSQLADAAAMDEETQQFVDDWSSIMDIVRQVNAALTTQQKIVVVAKIIELVFVDNEISERQGNLIFYIGQGLKIPQKDIQLLRTFVTGQDIDELASQNIMIIDEGSDEISHPGPRIVAKNLTGLIAILRLPDSEMYLVKYLGISTLYLNSIHLKSRKVDVFPTGSTIRGSKIETIYYSDVVSRFHAGSGKASITFSVEHLFYHFTSGRAALQNINLYEEGGKLIGIMGASGSGKSTLLSVLNGSEKPSSGRVLINSINIHESPDRVEGVIGYVPQDDLLMEDLTVYQNLYYAARLCFGHRTDDQIQKVVDRVINNLGLVEIKDLKVGSPLDKAISGGQRKRLNIGLELLREPTVLFVDEPTSGLSSRDSENIMDLLKELSLRGKMVYVVIHQPSSDIFKMFDSLLILDVGGFQIYYGHPIEAVNYFRDIINAANKNQGACPECGNINPEQIFTIIETRIVNEYGRLTQTRKISAGQWYQYFKQKIKLPRIRHVKDPLPVVQEIPNWVKQFKVFSVRDILAKLANKQYLYINLLVAPLLAFFISFMVKYYNILTGEGASYTFYDNENIPVYFFMSVVVSIFFGLTMSAEEIFRDRKILKRERFLHLSRSSYLVSKVMVMFLISAIQTISFVVVGNLVLGIPPSELRYWFILFSSSCFANMLGLNISSGFSSAVTIYILIPVLVIPQMLLSGVVINFDKFNPTVGKPVGVPLVGEFMASRWAFEAYMVTQFKDNPFERQFYNLDKEISMSEYKRVYYVPELESKLAYCLNNRENWNNRRHDGLNASLELLRNEIGSELKLVGADKLPEVKSLHIGQFDSTAYSATARFLRVLRQYYTNKMNRAASEKQAIVDSLTRTPQDLQRFERLRANYVNKAVESAVKNVTTPVRIVEFKGDLVQRIYPIYNDEHKPDHPFDFTANLYQPTKYFAGFTMDTLVFNLLVIWSMTLVLFVTLYFELLQRIMLSFDRRKKQKRATLN